jgi:putative ABC transport system substrate-binding protein
VPNAKPLLAFADRRHLLRLAACLPLTPAAWARTRGNVRVGVLANGAARQGTVRTGYENALVEACRRAGFSATVEFRAANLDRDTLLRLADELLRLPCDVVMCDDTFAARAVIERTSSVPLLFRSHADPVHFGLVSSLSRPGANASGVLTYSSSDRKLTELLLDALDGLRRIGMIYDARYQGDGMALAASQAQAAGARVYGIDVANPALLLDALHASRPLRLQAFVVPVTAPAWMRRRDLISWLTERRLPAVFGRAEFATAGGWAAFGPVASRADEQLADYLTRVLKGTPVGDLPVLRPDRHELVLNLTTARTIDRLPRRDFMRRVDRTVG